MKREKIFEKFLWNSRFIVLVAVVASLLVGLSMFIVSTTDIVHLFRSIIAYIAGTASDGNLSVTHGALGDVSNTVMEDARSEIVGNTVEIIDGYLLATMMLVFAFGLYELFISRIDAAEGNELASRVLLIQNMDDLKDRLSKLVLLILVVKFFKHAVKLSAPGPLDLLYFAIGIFLIGAALYLSHKKSPLPGQGKKPIKNLDGVIDLQQKNFQTS